MNLTIDHKEIPDVRLAFLDETPRKRDIKFRDKANNMRFEQDCWKEDRKIVESWDRINKKIDYDEKNMKYRLRGYKKGKRVSNFGRFNFK